MSILYPPASRTPDGSTAYNLAAIAALVLLLAVGAGYVLDRAGQNSQLVAPSLTDTNPLVQTLGGRELTIPANWFRHGEQLQSGFVSQVDLQTRLGLSLSAPPVAVDVTLLPRGRVRASATLLDTVYLHQFAGPTLSGAAGLVGKPLREMDGYEGETVWYDALSPGPFVAKCQAAVEAGSPDRCLRTVHLPSGLAAVFSFDATALENWRLFDAEMARWLDHIGAM